MQSIPITTTCRACVLLSAVGQPELLTHAHREEVLEFLRDRPVHCAYLSGLIIENGITSFLNRGTFYAYRDALGEIQGVALVGHATIIEALNDEALKVFAETAKACKTAHLIMCEKDRTENFCGHYSNGGQLIRNIRRVLLFELRWPLDVPNEVARLRPASTEDIEMLVPVHARLAHQESGVDPREVDNDGFVERYRRRIQQQRTWVLTENDQLIFKADVVTETRQNTYVEGIWVHPDFRRKGYGRNCMAQLARMLLWRTRSICLLVGDEDGESQAFYKRCGYQLRGAYDTIFLDPIQTPNDHD
jgi:ribosomal protein S18 acetylase RimI-like enzyme